MHVLPALSQFCPLFTSHLQSQFPWAALCLLRIETSLSSSADKCELMLTTANTCLVQRLEDNKHQCRKVNHQNVPPTLKLIDTLQEQTFKAAKAAVFRTRGRYHPPSPSLNWLQSYLYLFCATIEFRLLFPIFPVSSLGQPASSNKV